MIGGERLVVVWYTYTPDGLPTFLAGVAGRSGSAFTGTLKQYAGMSFGTFNPLDNNESDWGELRRDFQRLQYRRGQLDDHHARLQQRRHPHSAPDPYRRLPCTEDPVAGNFAITLNEDGQRYIGHAILLPGGDMFYAYGDLEVEWVGAGSWEQSGLLNASFNSTRWMIDTNAGSPYDSEGYSGGVILTRDGFTGLGSALLAGTRLDTFNNRVNLADIAGFYTITDDLGSFSFASVNVQSDGSIIGEVVNGCSLEGQVSIPVIGANQLAVSVVSMDPRDFCANTGFDGGGFVIDPNDVTEPNDWEVYGVNEARDYATVYKFRR